MDTHEIIVNSVLFLGFSMKLQEVWTKLKGVQRFSTLLAWVIKLRKRKREEIRMQMTHFISCSTLWGWFILFKNNYVKGN